MDIPVLNHELADDELTWVREVYADFAAARTASPSTKPREIVREVLGRPQHALPQPIDLTGDGVWRGGRNQHGRLVAAVFLPTVELHTHLASRTDQFPMYVAGEAEGFALDEAGRGYLEPVVGGGHFHNPPGAHHAFVPKTGQAVPADWEIAFIAITPRNLREDTHAVPDSVKREYERVVGRPAPTRV